jgi:uncharacterized protein (TIGR02996 family)
MSQETAFIRAILASPNDAALRLVYAAWLEEQGDPRSGRARTDSRGVEKRVQRMRPEDFDRLLRGEED